mgnify:CR=1 FL=1
MRTGPMEIVGKPGSGDDAISQHKALAMGKNCTGQSLSGIKGNQGSPPGVSSSRPGKNPYFGKK